MFKFNFSSLRSSLNDLNVRHDKNISPEKIQKLYKSVGWQLREIDKIKKSLNESVLVTSVWKEDVLVAFARATGDGVFNVTIWDVAVKPDFQKKGIGKLLLKSMLTKLDDYDIPLITLYSELDKKDFYSKLGFEYNSKNIIAMYRYNTLNKNL